MTAGTTPEGVPAATATGDDLRAVMRNWAAGVAIATTFHDGRDHAVTVNSFTSVSLDPPLVLVCIGRVSRFGAPVRGSGTWAVSLLPADAADLALRLAKPGGPEGPVLAGIPHRAGVTGAALLDDALATLECRTVAIHPGGDHDIVVGEVLSTSVGPVEDRDVPAAAGPAGDDDPRGPLVSFRGGFRTCSD
ncbi:flavin reductase family protein [Mobilicoccus pelagius]|uniref:Putative oxidoreductase n=1 Tax=Mobilicoccus pelagius NBRC 104925 TaxID=1089455 RepID=H5URL8_9MICO|nr:flavin reductase family protein [Mobilicoccus pelagius]GAB48376.1 putative oxidoreductase [Mobilicoccus pelagius NBRC 104925]